VVHTVEEAVDEEGGEGGACAGHDGELGLVCGAQASPEGAQQGVEHPGKGDQAQEAAAGEDVEVDVVGVVEQGSGRDGVGAQEEGGVGVRSAAEEGVFEEGVDRRLPQVAARAEDGDMGGVDRLAVEHGSQACEDDRTEQKHNG